MTHASQCEHRHPSIAKNPAKTCSTHADITVQQSHSQHYDDPGSRDRRFENVGQIIIITDYQTSTSEQSDDRKPTASVPSSTGDHSDQA
jgi:hypothetical protein